ncbi:MAG: PIN domain protein [Chitinivibrionia bacterium]|nr:PIN domain protein [Chitinivibrionia bacterium]
MLVYLDNCCYNRPFDDLSFVSVQLEAEAVSIIQWLIKDGTYKLVWSYMLDYENSQNPYENRKISIGKWREFAIKDIDESREIIEQGKLIAKLNVKPKDSLHISCAVFAKCNYFITTDNKLLSKIVKNIEIINPIDFLREQGVRL